MITINNTPGLRELFDDCQLKAQQLIGLPIGVTFKIRFHSLTDQILKTVICEVCGVTWKQIISDSREREYMIPRQMYCYFAFTLQGNTYTDIANKLNYSDHTSVSRHKKIVMNLVENHDALYEPIYNAIELRIIEAIGK